MKQLNYQVVIEKASSNYGAYVPDLPGCTTTGSTIDETIANIQEAIQFYLDDMEEEREVVPPPNAIVREVCAQIAA